MAVVTGRVTLGSTGLNSYNLGIQPTWARFEIVSDDCISLGNADGTRQNVLYKYNDTSTKDSDSFNTHVIKLMGYVGGSFVPIVEASFSAFTATGVQLNVTQANASYRLHITCGN